jgi:hypothetical protein
MTETRRKHRHKHQFAGESVDGGHQRYRCRKFRRSAAEIQGTRVARVASAFASRTRIVSAGHKNNTPRRAPRTHFTGLRFSRSFALSNTSAIVLARFVQARLAQAIPSDKRPFTFEDMMALKRVGAPVPSPAAQWVVFDCVDVDLNANTKISHLWIVPAAGPAAAGRRLNPTPNDERPRFSPDGKRLI